MKQKIIFISFAAMLLLACNGKKSKSDSQVIKSETIELEKEIVKNDSISNAIENKMKKIKSTSDNLETLLNDLN